MEEAWAEIEALQSIFENEISVEEQNDGSLLVVEKKVRPNDDDKVSSASIRLKFVLNPEYPSSSPDVVVSNARGICDDSLADLKREIKQRLKENCGMPVMFDIIQLSSDFLLSHQHSASLLCPICLCPLASSGISSTKCDHYVHTDCISEHTLFTRKQIGQKLKSTPPHLRNEVDTFLLCPVCREVIEENIEPIYSSPTKKGKGRRSSNSTSKEKRKEGQQDFDFDWKSWRVQQSAMRVLFEKQRNQGGIIDLEEERKKNLITEDTVVVLPTSSATDDNSLGGLPEGESAQGPVRPLPSSGGEPRVRSDRPPTTHNRGKPPFRGCGKSNRHRETGGSMPSSTSSEKAGSKASDVRPNPSDSSARKPDDAHRGKRRGRSYFPPSHRGNRAGTKTQPSNATTENKNAN